MSKELVKDMTWSYSRLDSFNTCKLMWKNSYIDDVDKESNAWSDIGTFCHEIMEDVANENISPGDAVEMFKDGYDERVPEFPKFPLNLKKHYLKNSTPFFEDFKGFKHEVKGVELKFDYLLPDGSQFMGYIDLVVEHNGNISLVDYKVSNPKNFKGKELKKKTRQLYMYAPAIKKIFGKYPKRMIFSFFQGGSVIEEFDESKLEETLKWATDTIAKIKKEEEFEHTDDEFFCDKICSFRSSCTKKEGYEENRFTSVR